MSAEHDATGFVNLFGAALKNGREIVKIAGAGPGENRKSGKGSASHGVNVAQSVGGGDGSESEGIVDDRGEKVHCLHQSEVWRETIHSGVVRRFEADEHVRICHARDAGEHLVQNLWTQFRRSTGRLHVGS